MQAYIMYNDELFPQGRGGTRQPASQLRANCAVTQFHAYTCEPDREKKRYLRVSESFKKLSRYSMSNPFV
uniref:Uncharacterized protein n=1 Tax=Trichogramma kaykai TaxID=54128 RepID=A0ABD2WW14_9HYME